MTIQQWFDRGCDYDQGVKLFKSKGGAPALVRVFETRKGAFNARKLKVELSKMRDKDVVIQKNKVVPIRVSAEKIKQSPENKTITSKPISAYPVELHEVYNFRIQTFLKAASLKIRLNDIPDDDQENALAIQLQIWELLKKNEKCWSILDHYDATGQILPFATKKDFSRLTHEQCFNKRQRLYVNVSKRKKTIEKMQAEYLQETKEAVKERLAEKILQKQKELQERQNDIDELTEIIKNNE